MLVRVAASCVIALSSGLAFAAQPVEVRAKEGIDFSRYATYAWAAREEYVADHPLADGSALDTQIKSMADRSLGRKGFSRVERESAPDLMINYVGMAEDVLQMEGASKEVARGVTWIGDVNAHSMRSYRQGTLVFEVVDSASGEMVWSAWVTELAPDVEKLRAKAEKATHRVFKHFPSR